MTDTTENTSSKDPEDLTEIARRFADLWQAHLSAMAEDPSLARQVVEGMAAFQRLSGMGMPGWTVGQVPGEGPEPSATGPVAAMVQAMTVWQDMAMRAQSGTGGVQDAQSHDPTAKQNATGRNTTDSNTTGPEAPCPASDGSEQLLHDLHRRLTRLEERFAELDSDTKG
jgi:hypothetical protein